MSGSTVSMIENTVLTTFPGLVAMAFANKAAGISSTVQSTIGTLDAESAAAVTKLQGELDTLETSSPLVEQVISALHSVAKTIGLALPAEDAVFAGVKLAMHDVLSALKAA